MLSNWVVLPDRRATFAFHAAAICLLLLKPPHRVAAAL
jgi:hypothetical protein